MYDCVRGSDDEIRLKRRSEPWVSVCVRWLTRCEANVSRHLTGPKVTLAVTDQSGLAE